MAETAFSLSHIESHHDGSAVPAGRHAFRGWVWPKPGGHFVDVRARINGQIFPGVHGLPRPDLAAHFKTGHPVALAEFYLICDLRPGPANVVLEVLEIEGRWRAFQQITLNVAAGHPQEHMSAADPRLRWIDHGHGLHLLLRELGRQPHKTLRELAAELAVELPVPRVLRDAPPPLIGFVDEPASVCCCRFGRIPAFGHLFHPAQKIRRILASVDLQAWQALEIGHPSPGPAAHYPQYPNARDCGFVGLVDVPAQLPNPVSLRIYAELEDGSLHLGPVVRTRLHTQDVEKLPVRTRTDLNFDAALTAWNDALAKRGFALPRDAESDRYLAGLRSEYETSLPPKAPPRHEPAVAKPPGKFLPRTLLLATHGLSLQGAPRFLLELAQACAEAGDTIKVVSAEDGPLRPEFEAIGATVRIVNCSPVHQSTDPADARAAIAKLVEQVDWHACDLVVANSFTTFWAVHAAKAAGKPVLLYVHESTTPRLFYDQRITPAALALAESAFAVANVVSFTTAATRDVHLGHGGTDRYVITPGWANLAKLDRWIAGQNRNELRRCFGIANDEMLVCNIGTVSDRKGQHTFARAVDLLWRRHPEIAVRTKFILLGGRKTPFDTMLGDVLTELGRDNLIVHPETTDYLRYYLAADIFACSSYEESSPRVIFEAMACRVPIIASAVHGIPELVQPDLEALLVPAGDTVAWADALARMLSAPAAAATLAHRARARVENEFSDRVLLPQHLALMQITVAASGA